MWEGRQELLCSDEVRCSACGRPLANPVANPVQLPPEARHDKVREASRVPHALLGHPAVGPGEKLLAATSSDDFP